MGDRRKERLFALQDGRCFYCAQPMFVLNAISVSEFKALHGLSSRRVARKREATKEHLTRRADGGTGKAHNIVLACAGCNSKRGDTDWQVYKALKQPKPPIGDETT